MRPKVLVFATLTPWPIDRGDRNRLFHVLKLLGEAAQVRLICLERSWEPTIRNAGSIVGLDIHPLSISKNEVLVQVARSIITNRPHTIFRYCPPRVIDFVRDELKKFKADVFWGYQLTAYPIMCAEKTPRCVLDMVDSASLYHRMIRASRNLSWQTRAINLLQRRVEHFERQSIVESDSVLISSEKDRSHLLKLHHLPEEKIIILDNCVPRSLLASEWKPDQLGGPRLLFVGNLAYPPNESAVMLFVNEVLPRIQREISGVEFVVCGSRGEWLQAKLGHIQGVHFAGYVDDLVSMYLTASALVAPAPMATGTPYKLLEALAVGLPVVISPELAGTIGLVHGQEALIADSPPTFAAAVVSLLRDPGLAARLSTAGKRIVALNYVWEGKSDLVRSLLY